jgi:integrase
MVPVRSVEPEDAIGVSAVLSDKRVRAANRLNALKVQKAKGPAVLDDGNGLRLLISEDGHKRWAVRITIAGRRSTRGLGSYPDVTLEAARDRAEDMRRAARAGRDLSVEIKVEQARYTLTFRRAFERYFEEVKRPTLKEGRFMGEWHRSLNQYVMPKIGDRAVADIAPAEIIDLLQPIWHTKRETASRILQRIAAVFKSAIVRGDRLLANPCDGVREELGKARPPVQHRRALPWAEVPTFIKDFEQWPMVTSSSRLALLFIIHTSCRSLEVRGAQWPEIDLLAGEWTVPAVRMKMNREHIVPLTTGARAVLERARDLRRNDTDLVFPSSKGTTLSDNTLSKLLRDAKVDGTPHGFRTSFKVWASENGVRDEVSEAVLAHGDPDRVRAAYRRTTFLDDRRFEMQRWSDFVDGPTTR